MTCEDCVQSLARTVFESLLCLAIILTYVPQYISMANHGTYGISPWFILSTTLFSTTQFASRLVNQSAKKAFVCVNGGELYGEEQLRGFRAYSALLGFVQAAVQWLCVVLILIIYLTYCTSSSNDPPSRQTGILSRPISSHTLRTILVTYNVLIIPLGLYILWRPDWTEDHYNREFFWRIFEIYLDAIWSYSLVILVLLQYVPQILTTLSLRTRGSISIVSLGLQIFVFMWLGISQALRLGIPKRESSQAPYTMPQLYFVVGHLSVNYVIAAFGQVALLIVCLYVDWGHIRQNGVLRL